MAFVGTRRALLSSALPDWAKGMDAWYDYTVPRGTPLLGFPPATDTHAGTIYASQSANGQLAPFTANVPVITTVGLQTTPTRTNLLLWSQKFSDANWAKLRATVTDDAAVAPDGTTTADELLDTAVAGTHVAIQVITKAASSITYAADVYLKKNVRDQGELRFSDQAGNGVRCTFNLTTGSVGSAAAFGTGFTAGSSAVYALVNNWYRVILVGTTNSATTLGEEIYIADAAGSVSYTGTGAGFYVWNGELAAASFASAPIPTTSSTVTVNGNQQVIDATGKLANGISGFVKLNNIGSYVSGARVFEVNDGSASNSASLYGSGGNLVFELFSGGVSQGSINLGAWATGAQTIAFSAGTNFIQARKVGGSANSADTTATYPTMTKLNYGGQGFQATNNNYQTLSRAAFSYAVASQSVFDQVFAAAQLAAASP